METRKREASRVPHVFKFHSQKHQIHNGTRRKWKNSIPGRLVERRVDSGLNHTVNRKSTHTNRSHHHPATNRGILKTLFMSTIYEIKYTSQKKKEIYLTSSGKTVIIIVLREKY